MLRRSNFVIRDGATIPAWRWTLLRVDRTSPEDGILCYRSGSRSVERAAHWYSLVVIAGISGAVIGMILQIVTGMDIALFLALTPVIVLTAVDILNRWRTRMTAPLLESGVVAVRPRNKARRKLDSAIRDARRINRYTVDDPLRDRLIQELHRLDWHLAETYAVFGKFGITSEELSPDEAYTAQVNAPAVFDYLQTVNASIDRVALDAADLAAISAAAESR